MAKDLRTFLKQLLDRSPGEIRVVDKEVDPRFGITAYAARLAQRGESPGLLFPNVKGTDFACLTNLITTYERIAMYLECEVEDIPRVYGERLRQPIAPHIVSRDEATVKEVIVPVEEADLSRIPIPVHNELDGGPYLTAAVMIIRDPDSGVLNAGIYRHHIFNSHEMGVWFLGAHHGGLIYNKYRAMGKPAPVAIAIGHHPGFLMGAVSRIQGFGSEFDAAGALMGESLALVQAEHSDLLVPAHAEMIIEGEILPDHDQQEGPFGEWPGHYLGAAVVPTIRVTGITHRKDAIFQDVVASSREHLILGGVPRSGSVYHSVKQVVPSLKNAHVPYFSRMHCYLSIKKERDADVKKAAFAALNTEQENLLTIVVVDDDIDIFNVQEVMWAIGTRCDAGRDMHVIPRWNGPGGLLPTNWDYMEDGTHVPRMSSALIIDATKPAPPVEYPVRAMVPAEHVRNVDLDALREMSPAERERWLESLRTSLA